MIEQVQIETSDELPNFGDELEDEALDRETNFTGRSPFDPRRCAPAR